MVDLGRDFHAPRHADVREWRKVALLVDACAVAGARAVDPLARKWRLFDSCGCNGPGPRPRTLADAQTQLGRRRSDRRAPAVKRYVRIGRGRMPAATVNAL